MRPASMAAPMQRDLITGFILDDVVILGVIEEDHN